MVIVAWWGVVATGYPHGFDHHTKVHPRPRLAHSFHMCVYELHCGATCSTCWHMLAHVVTCVEAFP